VIRWYAVCTQPHAETKVLEHLLRQGYSAYLPRYRARVRHARPCQIVLRPLFPRHLFAGIDRASMRWRPILSTIGVANVVRAGDEPSPVPSEIVNLIGSRRRLEVSTGAIRNNRCD
jgi:transcriptional antiterminator RfaH